MICVTGDTHGEQGRFLYSEGERGWTAEDVIIVCGDWGYLFRNDYSENRFLDDLEARPYTICFVDGNHENFPALFSYPEEVWNGGRVHRIRKNIFHLMRGQVFTIQGKTFFTFGGAFSIDRDIRVLGRSWWKEEIPTEAEMEEGRANLAKAGMKVDCIITHTAPGWLTKQLGGEVFETDEEDPWANDRKLTDYLDEIMTGVSFGHWYFGHWHRDRRMTHNITALWFDEIRLN